MSLTNKQYNILYKYKDNWDNVYSIIGLSSFITHNFIFRLTQKKCYERYSCLEFMCAKILYYLKYIDKKER